MDKDRELENEASKAFDNCGETLHDPQDVEEMIETSVLYASIKKAAKAEYRDGFIHGYLVAKGYVYSSYDGWNKDGGRVKK